MGGANLLRPLQLFIIAASLQSVTGRRLSQVNSVDQVCQTFRVESLFVPRNVQQSSTSSSSQPRIAIIGAGLAGLAAANQLINKYNFAQVNILEGLDRPGGRVQADVSKDGLLYHLGAQFIHSKQTELFEWALRNNLIDPTVTQDEAVIHLGRNAPDIPASVETTIWSFTEIDENRLFRLLRRSTQTNIRSTGQLKSSAIRQELAQRGEQAYTDRAITVVRGLDELLAAAADWNDVSIAPYVCDASEFGSGDDGDIEMKAPSTQYFVRRLVNSLKPGTIRYNNRVTNINYAGINQPIRVTLASGEILNYDNVIFTGSAGVLKSSAHTMFTPPLPAYKMDAISDIGFGTVDKVLLTFPQTFWDPKVPFIAMSANIGSIRERNPQSLVDVFSTAGYSLYTHVPNTLLAWVTGSLNRINMIENASEAQLSEAAYQAFLTMTKYNPAHIRRPIAVRRSEWHKNDLFRGSYSYVSTKMASSGTSMSDIAQPVVSLTNQLLVQFAGEATSQFDYSMIHGAYDSGVREANRLAVAYGRM